jgi:hypothetical protein
MYQTKYYFPINKSFDQLTFHELEDLSKQHPELIPLLLAYLSRKNNYLH